MKTKKIMYKFETISVVIEADDEISIKDRQTNNVIATDENGNVMWSIAELLKKYSEENGLKYLEELFFDCEIVDESKAKLVGFYNHCIVDLHSNKITALINNR